MRRLALLLAVLAPAALGAVVQPVSIESLARTSDAVVRGRVARQAARWAGDGRRIFTGVEIEVASVWRGAAPQRVVVEVPGGAVDGIAQRVDAAPAFDDGEDVVVFLARHGDAWAVRGLALGKFRIAGGEARPTLTGLRFAPGSVPEGERAVGTVPVEELERRVRAQR